MKRLADLDPRWLLRDGVRIGFVFNCPTRADEKQTCFFAPTPRREQIEAVRGLYGNMADDDKPDLSHIQLCDEDCGWKISAPLTAETATFETISVTPSLDGSKGGNWHGHITNGECDAC